MGAEAPAIQMIFFIVATSLAAGAATVMSGSILGVADGLSSRFTTMETTLQTAVVVVNDPGKVPVNPTLLYVKNIGSRIIEPASVTVIFDGRYVNTTFAIQNGAPRWAPADLVRFDISTSELTVAAGDHVVRVVTEGGGVSEFRFRST